MGMKRLIAIAAILALCALPMLFSQAVVTSGATVVSGQASVTSTAAALANNPVRGGVCLTVASGSANTVFVGGSAVSTTTGFEIQKSSASVQPILCLAVNNTAAIFAVSSGTATLDWVEVAK